MARTIYLVAGSWGMEPWIYLPVHHAIASHDVITKLVTSSVENTNRLKLCPPVNHRIALFVGGELVPFSGPASSKLRDGHAVARTAAGPRLIQLQGHRRHDGRVTGGEEGAER